MSRVYIICPPNTTTGGAELLHQLIYKLNLIEKDFAIALYKDYTSDNHPTPIIYQKYTDSKFVTKAENNHHNYIIIPEINTQLIKYYSKSNIIIWWLSVDNFIGSIYKTNVKELDRINSLNYLSRNFLKLLRVVGILKNFDPLTKQYLYNQSVKLHAYQSVFAKEFVENKNLSPGMMLSDYLNDTFIANVSNTVSKKNNILYNPVKGFEITKKLIEAFPDYNWIPLQGYTPQQMDQIMKESKIYIDFGNHPGKDRIPREAAINDCIIITNRKGSAANDIDVMIQNQYKFSDVNSDIQLFKKLVDDIFLNFTEHLKNFEEYKNNIKSEESIFDKEVLNLFNFLKN